MIGTLLAATPIEHVTQRYQLFLQDLPEWLWRDWTMGGLGISKPVIYMIFASGLLCAVFISMARNWQLVPRPRGNGFVGLLQALFEPLLVFVRNDIVRAQIKAPHRHGHGDGHDTHATGLHDTHGQTVGGAIDPTASGTATAASSNAAEPLSQRRRDEMFADMFLPFHWTIFFFILFCNVIGLTPEASTPTGQIAVTATLAAISLLVIIGSGIYQNGVLRYWYNFVPHDIPPFWFKVIPNPIWLLVFIVEFVGLFFKPVALAIRLFATMTGGHVMIGVLLGFAVAMNLWHPFAGFDPTMPLWAGVPIAMVSLLAAVAVYLLELIIALVQAYVFTLLTATFIGMAINQDH